MENIHLNDHVRVLHSAVNMGLVETEHGVVVIDTGLDRQSGKQLLKAAGEWGKPIIAVLNTHAHADHFGGNHVILANHDTNHTIVTSRRPSGSASSSTLGSASGSALGSALGSASSSAAGTADPANETGLPVYAPVFEADVIRRPRYEPEYLWQGAAPVAQLQNKFLEAKPSPVTNEFVPGDLLVIDGVSFETVSLAGHSVNQAGVLVHDVFFAADSYFATEVTEKHGIPYMVNYRQTLESAEAVLGQKASFYVPGHGQPLDKPPVSDVAFLTGCHKTLFEGAVSLIQADPILFEQLISTLCAQKAVNPNSLGSYVLVRTPISAYITAAVEEGLVDIRIIAGQVILCAAEKQQS
jgi:glyoxylase-like metal-dependent hydrolase (beta-lactamase superfamily II)